MLHLDGVISYPEKFVFEKYVRIKMRLVLLFKSVKKKHVKNEALDMTICLLKVCLQKKTLISNKTAVSHCDQKQTQF